MKEYRQAVMKAASVPQKLKDDFKRINNEGRTPEWTAKEKALAVKIRKAELDGATDTLFRASLEGFIEARKAAEKLRRRGANPLRNPDGTEKLFHQQRASQMLQGLNEEESIEAYRAMTLHEEDRTYKWIYEDALKAKVRDADYAQAVEQTIDSKRTPEEREALAEVEKAGRMREHDTTIRNLLASQLNEIAAGEEPTKWDFDEVLTEMEKNVNPPEGAQGPQSVSM